MLSPRVVAAANSFQVLVIEDHALFADALAGVVRQLRPGTEVTIASSAEEASERLRTLRADLVLLDLGLSGAKGRAAFELVTAQARGAPIVVVSAAEPSAEVKGLLEAGARGYVHKRASSDELKAVLRFVLDGGTHVPPALLAVPSPAADGLTGRQREVLRLLAKGLSNKEIADQLGIAEATVRVHVSTVLRVLGVENRTQAATSPLARQLAGE